MIYGDNTEDIQENQDILENVTYIITINVGISMLFKTQDHLRDAKIMQQLLFFFFWSGCVACRILVPQPGIKPGHLALEAQNLYHWTTREVSMLKLLTK